MKPVTFAEKLRRWRGNRAPKEAAYILGIPYSTYRAYENGGRVPHHNCCADCLETKMHLSVSAVIPIPVALLK